jgi:antitoxin YefM
LGTYEENPDHYVTAKALEAAVDRPEVPIIRNNWRSRLYMGFVRNTIKHGVVNLNNVHNFVHIKVHMLTTTLSDFRRDIKSYLDKVTQGFETLIINRGKDSGVVIISLEEYNSLKATQHEMSSRANEQHLDASIAQLKAGRTVRKKLIEE